ncbi:MAG: hypothetical protein ACLQDV_09220 [Candidatus Binataceae bacterium]
METAPARITGGRLELLVALALSSIFFGPVPSSAAKDAAPITFYAYPARLEELPGIAVRPGESEEAKTERALEEEFTEIRNHLGRSSPKGRIGIALNYPYTVFLEGDGPDHFQVRTDTAHLYEINIRVAQKRGMPVMVGFNGADWAGPGGAFNAYWKTADGGKYLSRYQDGRVNASISIAWESIPNTTLQQFLDRDPYDHEGGKNALLLTKSSDAKPLVTSRSVVLKMALEFWKSLDQKYPGTIQAFTTDSEVASWSFRQASDGKAIPVGFEAVMTAPFCRQYGIKSCREYMASHHFDYQSEEDRRWFRFRADAHRAFVQSTANAIHAVFPDRPIFTHQIVTLDGQYLFPYRSYDWASPQETAFVDGANPGFTFYIYNRDDAYFRTLVSQFRREGQSRAPPVGNHGVPSGQDVERKPRGAARLHAGYSQLSANERCRRVRTVRLGNHASRSRVEGLGC